MCAHSFAASPSLANGDWPGERVEEHAAERVDVGAPVHLLAADLLRRDVVDGPDELAGAGQPLRGGGVLGEPEVRQVDVVALVAALDEDVAGLDVAVHEAAGVRRVERAPDVGDDLRRARRLQRPLLGDDRPEVGPVDVAHRDEQRARILSRVVHGDDVGVIDRRDVAQLAREARAELDLLGELGRDELERDMTLQHDVDRLVDDPHPAAADESLEAIASDN